MGKIFRQRFEAAAPDVISCAGCGANLCTATDIVSRHFHGKHGKALLVSRCANSFFGPQEQKLLMTGVHIVRDVYCRVCGLGLGWTYDFAHEERERYKTCKTVLECRMISGAAVEARDA